MCSVVPGTVTAASDKPIGAGTARMVRAVKEVTN